MTQFVFTNAGGKIVTLKNPDTNTQTLEIDVSNIMQKPVSTDKAIVRFIGVNGDVQNSNAYVDNYGKITCGTAVGGDSIMIVGRASDNTSGLYFMNNDGVTSRAIMGPHASGELRTQALAGLDFTWRPISGSELMRLASDGSNLTLGLSSAGGPRSMNIDSGGLSNTDFVGFQARAGLSGTLNRYMVAHVYKHSGIANPCGNLQQSQQNGIILNYWTDDVGQLRSSTVSSNIGTTGGGLVGTQTSDERVKNIAGACPYGLQEILELETYKYSMKDDVEDSFKLGFVAQQAMGVIPESVYDTNERLTEAVTVTKYKVVQESQEEITEQVIDTPAVLGEDGTIIEEAIYKTTIVQEAKEEITEPYEDVEYVETEDEVTKLAMDYQMMIPVLVNAMKEQQAMINKLTEEINILKGVN